MFRFLARAGRPAALTVSLLALAALAAHGAAPPTVSADAHTEAKGFFDQGNRLVEQAARARGERAKELYTAALDAYLRSLGFARNRNVVFNTAILLTKLERHEESHSYFSEYLAMADLPAADRADAERRLAEVAAHVLVVDVRSTPPGASVRVDREDLPARGVTPATLAISPGGHRVFVSAPGYAVHTAELSGAAGERRALDVILEPSPIAVTFVVPDGESLVLDGAPAAAGIPLALRPGPHEALLRPSGVRAAVTVAVGDAPRTVTLERPPPSAPLDLAPKAEKDGDGRADLSPWPTVAWISTGVAGAAAIVLSAVALGANDDFEGMPTGARADDVDAANLRADVLWGVTGALGVTALVLTLLDGDGTPTEVDANRQASRARPLARGPRR